MTVFKGLYANRENLNSLVNVIKDCLKDNEAEIASKEEEGDIIYSLEDLLSNIRIVKSKPISRPKKSFYFARLFDSNGEFQFIVDRPNKQKSSVKHLMFKYYDLCVYIQKSGRYEIHRGVLTLMSVVSDDILCFTFNLNNGLNLAIFEAIIKNNDRNVILSVEDKGIVLKTIDNDVLVSIDNKQINVTSKKVVIEAVVEVASKIEKQNKVYFIAEKDKGFIRRII